MSDPSKAERPDRLDGQESHLGSGQCIGCGCDRIFSTHAVQMCSLVIEQLDRQARRYLTLFKDAEQENLVHTMSELRPFLQNMRIAQHELVSHICLPRSSLTVETCPSAFTKKNSEGRMRSCPGHESSSKDDVRTPARSHSVGSCAALPDNRELLLTISSNSRAGGRTGSRYCVSRSVRAI